MFGNDLDGSGMGKIVLNPTRKKGKKGDSCERKVQARIFLQN